MLSGVMLIVVTMFAVLGAYYLSDLLTRCLLRRKGTRDAVVVLRARTGERLWSDVLDLRALLPDLPVVVLCGKDGTPVPPGTELRGVTMATADTLADSIRSQFAEED